MKDKEFKMVRYDINGEVKNGHLSIWVKIKYGFIGAILLPLILEEINKRADLR